MKGSLITWKDADQNLCTIAAFILHAAMVELRQSNNLPGPIMPLMTNGERVSHSFVSPYPRSIFGFGEDTGVFGNEWFNNDIYSGDGGGPGTNNDGSPSSLCWWSFQNIVRFYLREAREEIKANLYARREREKRATPKRSRNYSKRSQGSKFGRTKDR